jgi:hypothetical protein
MDLHITQYQAIPPTGTSDDMNTALRNITNAGARIIMVAATSTPQINLMIQAQQLGYVSKDYVWLLMGDTTDDLRKQVDKYNNNNNTNTTIQYPDAYQGIFLFDNWLSLDGYPPFESFLDQWSVLNPES